MKLEGRKVAILIGSRGLFMDMREVLMQVQSSCLIYFYNRSSQFMSSDNLCVSCHKFYGNPQNLNMCSVCYKSHKKSEDVKEEVNKFKIPEIPQAEPSKQADHSKCFTCKKKVGLLGFRCKGCDCSYCNNHRLPEEHKCDGNFIDSAKMEMKKNNPNITAPKIEKI